MSVDGAPTYEQRRRELDLRDAERQRDWWQQAVQDRTERLELARLREADTHAAYDRAYDAACRAARPHFLPESSRGSEVRFPAPGPWQEAEQEHQRALAELTETERSAQYARRQVACWESRCRELAAPPAEPVPAGGGIAFSMPPPPPSAADAAGDAASTGPSASPAAPPAEPGYAEQLAALRQRLGL
jgi:hypothetical protein